MYEDSEVMYEDSEVAGIIVHQADDDGELAEAQLDQVAGGTPKSGSITVGSGQ